MTSLPNLICRSALGPTYQLENRTGLHILGPETHLVVEGQEIALICRWMISIIEHRQDHDHDLRDNLGKAELAWRKEGGLMPTGASMISGGQVVASHHYCEDDGDEDDDNGLTMRSDNEEVNHWGPCGDF